MSAREIDFRGKNRWGHALHGWTFEPCSAETRFGRFVDRLRGHRRWRFMCHSEQSPQIGMTVRWIGSDGGERAAEIYRVNACWNVSDMHTLFVLLRP